MDSLGKEMASMREMAGFLLRYEKTKEDRADLAILKTRELDVAGYRVVFNLSVERLEGCDIWTLQLYCKYQPFLPFKLVCDCAVSALGDSGLALVEFVLLGRKLYVWSVALDRGGKAIPVPARPNVEPRRYDGLEYAYATATGTISLLS